MEQIKDTEVRILYIQTNEISLLDIPRVLDEMGYAVYRAAFGISVQQYDDKVYRQIVTSIDKFKIHCVITYDFVETVAQACMETGIPYIAWVYDAPQKELYTHYALYPCNYIVAFDKMQVQRLKDIGINHVIHMPLAVHEEKIDMVTNVGEKAKDMSQNEIAFIGQLYKMENEKELLNRMDEKTRQQLQFNIDTCYMKWNKDAHLHGVLSEGCVAFFSEVDGHCIGERYPYMSEQFYYEAAFLSRAIANRERVHILNKLAEQYDVSFYTYDKNVSQLSERVKVKPGMPYDVLSHVYRKTKINLNITLHCIETGVPQRVFDIMAAGGFVLTNYQEELEELFVPGEEIAIYHNEQELEELVAYYLTHDEEREKIARKGQEKVLREYNYQRSLAKVFAYVDEAEREREETYQVIQRKELRKQADILLAQNTEAAHQQLYELFTNRVYELAIQKNTELSTLREMVECWSKEKILGVPCIFDDVKSLQQAEQKYVEIKHGFWRIEQGLPYEKCMEAVERMRQGKVSKFFAAWLIYVNLRDQEEAFLKLSRLMAESSLTEAVEMLSYGLLFLEENSELLVQQADFLMELNLWEQALQTLQTITNPTGEIREVIAELSDALNGKNE